MMKKYAVSTTNILQKIQCEMITSCHESIYKWFEIKAYLFCYFDICIISTYNSIHNHHVTKNFAIKLTSTTSTLKKNESEKRWKICFLTKIDLISNEKQHSERENQMKSTLFFFSIELFLNSRERLNFLLFISLRGCFFFIHRQHVLLLLPTHASFQSRCSFSTRMYKKIECLLRRQTKEWFQFFKYKLTHFVYFQKERTYQVNYKENQFLLESVESSSPLNIEWTQTTNQKLFPSFFRTTAICHLQFFEVLFNSPLNHHLS